MSSFTKKLLSAFTAGDECRSGSRPRLFAAALVATVLTSIPASAQIAAWDFTGENQLATSTAEIYGPNLDASSVLSRGTGATASVGANSFRTTGFQNNGISTANTDYFQFTLSASSGFTMSLSAIDAKLAGTSSYAVTPGVSQQFAYSLDGTTFTLIGSPTVTIGTPTTISVPLSGIPALQSVTSGTTVTFRYYASGQTSTGGWGFNSSASGIYGLAISGSTTAVGATPLTLSISPSSFSESAGVQTNIATLSIPSNAVGDQTFTLVSNDTTEATVPSSVTILNGTSSVSFSITPVNDFLADGNQTFSIVASAAGYLDGVQSITVNDDGDLPMTLSISPASFGEDAAVIVNGGTLTLPSAAVGDTVVTLTCSDTSEVTVPATVTVPDGATSVSFDVTPVNDIVVDGSQSAIITASSPIYSSGTFSVTVTDDGDLPPPIIISQYYEGLSSDKYIELYNTSASPVTLTGYRLAVWTNAGTEGWKTNTGTPTSNSSLSSITIPGNSYWLLKGAGSANPAYANNNANSSDITAVSGFNGNDSVVLYAGAGNEISNIVDAVSFTNTGGTGSGEGVDKSFYRIANTQGYNLTAGSNVTSFPAVWASKTLADVASAASTDAWYLNYYVAPQAPTLDVFVVGNSATSTTSPIVTLNYASSLGTPLEYRVSETADLSDATWTPLSSYLTYSLSSGAGTKTVYFQLRNATGVSAIASDTIDAAPYVYAPEVLITQYYEPDLAGLNSKYIELTNVSSSPVDMTSWSLVRWTNQDADHWQHTGAVHTASPNGSINLSGLGTLNPGQTVIIAHTSAASPIAAASAQLTSGNMSFNGNDSVALYRDSPSPNSLVDVVSFTNLGNEGPDQSFVRQSGSQGFSFTPGTSVLNFSSVWTSVSLATVGTAVTGQNNFLGTYPGGNTYDTWKTSNANGDAADVDTDGDGIDNGAEYFMGTLGNVFNQNPGPVSGVVTWPRATGTTISSFKVEVSTDLTTWEDAAINHSSQLAITSSSVAFTLPSTPGSFFVRLKVTP